MKRHDMIERIGSEYHNPDWQFMENYIKSLPYGDRLNG